MFRKTDNLTNFFYDDIKNYILKLLISIGKNYFDLYPSGPSGTKKETRTVLATNLGTLLFNVANFRERI